MNHISSRKLFSAFLILFLVFQTISGILTPIKLSLTSPFFKTQEVRAAGETWYNSSWPYRKAITITGSTAGAQTNYQVNVNVTYSSNMKSDFSDSRFTDSDGTTLLNYWLESHTVSTSASFWVKIPSIPAFPSTTTIYVYYGNNSATSASVFANVFIHGSDFSSDFGDLTSRTAGNGINEIVAAPQNLNDPRSYRIWSGSDSPVISPSNGYTYVRDIGVVRNLNNRIITESGKLIGYFASRNYISSTNDTSDVMRATSVDGGKTWVQTGQVISHGQGGIDDNTAGHSTVLKFGNNDYRMWYAARDVQANPYKIAYATSTDNLNWTRQGIIADSSLFNNPQPEGGPAIPWVTPLSNGTFVLLFEGRHYNTQLSRYEFHIYGMSSTDGITWSLLNGGSPVFSPSSAGFDSQHVANPKLVELPNGTYLLEYDGANNDTPDFQIGFATSNNPSVNVH
jgi:hypothetical protein